MMIADQRPFSVTGLCAVSLLMSGLCLVLAPEACSEASAQDSRPVAVPGHVAARAVEADGPVSVENGGALSSRSLREQLALELAVVSAHESGFYSLPDVSLVWEVTQARATTTAKRLAFLRAHSGRALGRKPCAALNCKWSTELLAAPNKPPASMSAAWWNAARADAWAKVRAHARALVFGTVTARVCSSVPYSWGSDRDMLSAHLRGLEAIACAGTLNTGVVLKARSVDAQEASGR